MRHVEIVEGKTSLIGLKGIKNSYERCSTSDEESQDSESNVFIERPVNENLNKEVLGPKRNKNEFVRRKSARDKRKPDFYSASMALTEYVYVNVASVDSPRNFREAMARDEANLWKNEMDEGMKNITKKTRIVVIGCQQSEVLDDLYSPVAVVQTLRLLLNFCCQFGLEICQMDEVTAFLNGKVKSEVFVKQPQGYDDGSGRVYKLKRALYGLRESPRAWFECFYGYI